MKLTETFILEHVGDLAFTLLGAAVGFLWKKLMDMVKEQKYLHDGVLAMLHDRLYLICTHYIKMGYIDTDGLDNVGIIYQAYHGLKGDGTGTNLYKRVCALPIKEGGRAAARAPLKFKMEAAMSKFKDISLATIVRTLCLAFALFNQVLSACGHPMIPLDNAQMEQFLTSVITVIAALVSWWKNNSFTKEAIEADKVYDKLVASRKRGD